MTTPVLSPVLAPDLPPTSPVVTLRPVSTAAPTRPAVAGSGALARFTATGMLAALDAYTAGRLGSARLRWELSVRLEQLDALPAPVSALTRLRWRHRTLEQLHDELGDRTPSAEKRQAITAAVADLRTALTSITRLA